MPVDLSIIVPVYNVEKYLDKCLNTLVNQTIENYEIIVVNDGTKDNSQKIIDKYVETYPLIVKSFIKENGGISDARNFGLKYATGKYLTFIDSDDYVEKDYYQGMIEIAIKEDCDLVVSDIKYVWENSSRTFFKSGLNEISLDMNKNALLSPLFAWNKLYKKDLYDQLGCEFPLGLWYEDLPVTINYIVHSKKIGYYSKVGVNYLQRTTSILGTGYSIKMYDIFPIFESITNKMKEQEMFEEYKDEIEYLYIEHMLLYGAFRYLRSDNYKDLMLKSFEFVKEMFPKYKSNKYLKHLGIKNRIFIASNNAFTMHFWHLYLRRNKG